MNNKVVIVGCGNVGMSYAYALINQNTYVTELVLVDILKDKTIGEAMDLSHGMPFSPSKVKVRAGSYSDCKDAKIVCICAGANQAPNETRLQLIERNYEIFKGIIPNIMKSGFDGILLVATNPVDAMSYFAYKLSNLPQNKVIGSGTTLDTSRLRFLISEKLNISSKNVHAYVLGEHGDSEFIPWSHASIGLESIYSYLKQKDLNIIGDDVKNAAYEVIKKKEVTNYGIGMCLVNITNAILEDQNLILCVSAYSKKDKIYVSVPCIVNINGIRKRVNFPLNKKESVSLKKSIKIIKNAISNIEKKEIK